LMGMKRKIQSSIIFPSGRNGVIFNSWLNGLIFPSVQNIVLNSLRFKLWLIDCLLHPPNFQAFGDFVLSGPASSMLSIL
jgi:hypothetical protein